MLAARASLAVMLLVAGGAKLADLPGFAAVVRLVIPLRLPRALARPMAFAVPATELALGAASLSLPAVGWLNPAVFVVCCGFLVASGTGYAFHRGHSCRCFGGLSSRRFGGGQIARSGALAVISGLAMTAVPSATVELGLASRVMLFLAGSLVALAAFSASHALGLARKADLEAS